MTAHIRSEAEPIKEISAKREMGAYEALWLEKKASFKSIAAQLAQASTTLPSALVDEKRALETAANVCDRLNQAGVKKFDICVNGMNSYPERLRDAQHSLALFYYQGSINLIDSAAVAVVGTRQPSDDGRRRARQITTELVSDGWTIISGLASGIDTEAHNAAMEAAGRTIAVLGTPISHTRPPENEQLQAFIAKHHLVISQTPVLRYEAHNRGRNGVFFPERNITMSALSHATIIVEATDTSGTIGQAREALRTGRKLFILENCFQDSNLKWPARFEQIGGIRVRSFDDIRQHLGTMHIDGTHAGGNRF